MILTLNLENLFKVTVYPSPEDTLSVMYELDWTNGNRFIVWRRILHVGLLWPQPLTYKFVQGHFMSPFYRKSFGKVWARLGQGEMKYGPDKDFSQKFATTLSFVQLTWFKVTAHPLNTCSLCQSMSKGTKYGS